MDVFIIVKKFPILLCDNYHWIILFLLILLMTSISIILRCLQPRCHSWCSSQLLSACIMVGNNGDWVIIATKIWISGGSTHVGAGDVHCRHQVSGMSTHMTVHSTLRSLKHFSHSSRLPLHSIIPTTTTIFQPNLPLTRIFLIRIPTSHSVGDSWWVEGRRDAIWRDESGWWKWVLDVIGKCYCFWRSFPQRLIRMVIRLIHQIRSIFFFKLRSHLYRTLNWHYRLNLIPWHS